LEISISCPSLLRVQDCVVEFLESGEVY